jgi:HEAT repeat protein
VLDGLDDVDWARLDSAYGKADRVPELLRTIAAGAPADGEGEAGEGEAGAADDPVDEALDEFINEVFHQGTVWECTEPAIPFVVELALVPTVTHRASLVYLLARLAYDGVDAVDPHAPRLMSLLDDPDDNVRETAAYLIGWLDVDAASALMRRWEIEPVPLVRASLLAAIGRHDLDAGRTLAERALGDPDPVLRAAAGLTLVWMRDWWSDDDDVPPPLPPPADMINAVASAFAEGDPLGRWVWSSNAQSEFLDGLAGMEGLGAPEQAGGAGGDRARDTMVEALVRSPSADTRRHTLYEIGDTILSSRSAPARLVPLLGPLLSDEDASVRGTAALTARRSGSAAGLVVDQLAERAATLPMNDGSQEEEEEDDSSAGAETALSTLVDLGDPRWRPMLLAAWRSPRTLPQAAMALESAAPAPDPELVGAVTARLAAQVDAAVAGAGRIGEEIDALAGLVGAWGAAGEPAADALITALAYEVGTDRPTPGVICHALANLGTAAMPALPALRTAAGRGFHGYDRLTAALAVWRLVGDVGPALEVGAVMLSGPNGYDEGLQAWIYPEMVTRLLPLGSDLVPLEPHLRRHIADHPERHVANCQLARVLWHLHGDADEVIPILRAGLSFTDHSDKPAPPSEAIRAAAELGERAAPLLGLLRRGLAADKTWVRAAAATTLLRLNAGDPDELVAAIVPQPEPYHRWWASSALGTLDDVSELRLTPAVPRLRAWLDTDERVDGNQDERVRLDERFQARVREVVAALA